MQWGTGAKVWLWLMLVVNALSCLGALALFAVIPALAIITLALEILMVVGVVLLLFGRRKLGYYLLCTCAVLAMISNIYWGTNIIRAVATAVVMPFVTYLVIKDQWNELA